MAAHAGMAGDPLIRVAVETPALIGESPFWHPHEQALYYCDIAGRRLQRFDPARRELKHWDFASEVASCAPLPGGQVLLAMRDGLWRFDPATEATTRLAEAPYDPAEERFNDGKCDPRGRFWVGTRCDSHTAPLAALYCFDRGCLTRRAVGISSSNGLGWSPDGRTMYWSDTSAHAIYAFDFDPASGGLGQRRLFASFSVKRPGQDLSLYGGRPDGAAVDVAGCYWVSMYEGQRLLRLSPAGELLREVALPVRCPTMPCFGGADLRTLYITTARDQRPADELAEQAYAGCVLELQVDVAGLPVNFAA